MNWNRLEVERRVQEMERSPWSDQTDHRVDADNQGVDPQGHSHAGSQANEGSCNAGSQTQNKKLSSDQPISGAQRLQDGRFPTPFSNGGDHGRRYVNGRY